MFDNFSPHALEVIRRADAWARGSGADAITTWHLLRAGVAVMSEAVHAPTGTADFEGLMHIPFTPQAALVCSRASESRVGAPRAEVSVEDLLATALCEVAEFQALIDRHA